MAAMQYEEAPGATEAAKRNKAVGKSPRGTLSRQRSCATQFELGELRSITGCCVAQCAGCARRKSCARARGRNLARLVGMLVPDGPIRIPRYQSLHFAASPSSRKCSDGHTGYNSRGRDSCS